LASLLLVGLMFIPVRLSTLAPAEVIALNAFSVAAPQDGVIHAFAVQPNAPIKKGDLLFTLDDTSIMNRYEVAAKSLATAKADALVAEQRSFDDGRAKAELAGATGRMREKEAELNAIEALMARVEIKAERDGIAVFSDANDWIGKPVQTGERVMQIANPNDAGLLMWLPLKDALNINKGANMKMFLHTDPLHPINAKLQQTSYQATLSPENVSSYKLKGAFDETNQAMPRIGLRGTARISGEWSILGYYLFRRPIAAAREWLGF
jgi:multidrug efflux pump subunit AcrA (membrane-fusion protein)